MSGDNGNRDPMTGYFRPGNKLGNAGGNPNAKRMAELKKALIACGTEEDVQSLYKTLLAAALGGDVPAAKLLLDHLVGRPTQSVEISGPDGEPNRVEVSTLVQVILAAVGDDMATRVKIAAALRQHRLGQPEEPVSGPADPA